MNATVISIGGQLRLREKRRRLAEDLVRALQFEVVAFELLQALAFVGRQARPLAAIALGLAHPASERLDATSSFSPTDRIAAHCDGCLAA